MRASASAPLLGALVLLSLVASSGCRNDTWFELTINLPTLARRPEIHQIQVEMVRSSDRARETLLFPQELPREPLVFPVTLVILLPNQLDSYDITITALDATGNPHPEVPPQQGFANAIASLPGDGEELRGELQVRQVVAGQYQTCVDDEDCDPQLRCLPILSALESAAFCVQIGCQRDIEGPDPAADPACNTPDGDPGRCFAFDTSAGTQFICLATCMTSEDCPEGLACNPTLANDVEEGLGGCVSQCDSDADCSGLSCVSDDDGATHYCF